MSLKLWLGARTPYAMQPSSIEFTLLVCNVGALPVRGPEPDAMCLETIDERGERLPYVPCGPSPFGPREIEVPPRAFLNLLKISSRACGGMRDVGLYEVRCHWQGATSNVVKYRVLGDREAYVATMRAVPGAIEVMLANGGSAPIVWPERCLPQDLTLRGPDGALVEAEPVDGDERTRVEPGAQVVLRFEVPDAPRGVPLTGRFAREPFASETVALVL